MTVDSTRAEAGKSGFFQSCNVAQLAQLTMKRVGCYIRAGLSTRATPRAHPRDLPLAPRAPRARSLPPFAPHILRQRPRSARSLFQLVMRNVSARELLAVE